ncbi:MAG: histidine kinase [Myxococcales bacterium]|nr:histidine kinase [Myxococcales bacterium]
MLDRVQQLEQVLESIKDAVLRVDRNLCVSLMNEAATTLLKARDWDGRSIEEVVKVPRFAEFLGRDNKQEDSSFEFELSRGPHTRHILARVTLQQDGGQVAVLRDVTTVRRLERMRRDFVANVSHELRTPISVVSANTETLLNGALHDEEFAPKLLDAVHRNSERLTLIINDLLDLSRLEAGSYSLHSGRSNVRSIAGRVVGSLVEKAEAKDTSVVVRVDGALSVMTDEAALFQVLVNYLENAIKYTPDKSTIEIVAHPRKGDARIRIEVRDNGPGIPDAYRNRIFERFFRVDPGRSREMGGTGLGLSIVKHLVEAMGGRVGVGKVEPSGSAFWIDLPKG